MDVEDPRLTGIWTKLDRGRTLIQEFEAAAQLYWRDHPLQFGDDTFTAFLAEDPAELPAFLAALMGDSAHNIRTALDYFAYAVADDVPATAFPVPKRAERPTATAWKQTVEQRLPGIPRALREFMLKAEIYPGGSLELIWLLHHLDIRDKHHLPLLATMAHQAVVFDASAQFRSMASQEGMEWLADTPSMPIALRPASIDHLREPLRAGYPLFTAPKSYFEEQGEQLKFQFDIVLAEPELMGKPAAGTLTEMADAVEQLLRRDLLPLV